MDDATRAHEAALAPVANNERIHALDIVRGFALVGIFLMNVEWFTRPITFLGTGVDASLSGADYAASWAIYTFVQGKFWTLFSLLFGMGFAVMLGRAEHAERAFVTPYVRRIIGLFLFGAAHYILLWTGDILHDYAVTATLLLLIVTRSWKAWLGVLLSVAAIGGAMFFAGNDGYESMVMTSVLLIVVAAFMFFIPGGPRSLYGKCGGGLYALPVVLTLGFAGVQMATADKPAADVPARMAAQGEAADAAAKTKAPSAAQSAAKEARDETAEREEKFAERMTQRSKDAAEETRIYTRASYPESVAHRAGQFRESLPDVASLSVLALPMFLIGFWFVRTGIIADWRRHLPLFKRLAAWTLPLGLAMTFYSVLVQPTAVPTAAPDPAGQIAKAIFLGAMLPMSVGYFSAMICLLGTGIGARLLSPLRFAGQMALTNYICATIIGTFYFSGYGLGHWGEVGRAGQVGFVFAVFPVQLVFSYFWLRAFRYGPLEWLWRAITYWTLPPMRR